MPRYVPLLRPAGFATLPQYLAWTYVEAPAQAGLANRPDLPTSRFQFGVIETDRALTLGELEHFGLEPATDDRTNIYATDGLCHNAQPGTYGHECGKPAAWLGKSASGMWGGFCARCRVDGYEARGIVEWEKLPC